MSDLASSPSPQLVDSNAAEDTKSASSTSSKRAEAMKAAVRAVDEAERATDTPVPASASVTSSSSSSSIAKPSFPAPPPPAFSPSEFASQTLALPSLASPFDSTYPLTTKPDKWKKLCDDAHCLMCEIQPGDSKSGNVPVLNRVYVNVEGKLADGTTFYDYTIEELDFTLGQAQVPKGLEMAVCQMSSGQHCLVRCLSDYGFSTTRRPPNVPASATLFFSVRIIRWEKEKNLHEMSLDDKYEYCNKRRSIGKELFATGVKPKSAARQYERAVSVLESIQNQQVDMKTVEKKNELLVVFLVNQAQCWMKVPDYPRVLDLCNKALKIAPHHVKALYRRADVRKLREEWDEAIKDYQKILEIHESSSSKEVIDESVITSCRTSISSIGVKRATQATLQRRKMNGFMKQASLYEDMPEVGAVDTTKTNADPSLVRPQQQDDDYSWLNTKEQPSMWTQMTQTMTFIVQRVRGWCGQRRQTKEKQED